ncbi:MAG: response regulator [Candidatus Sumerlaeia bacterium]
MSDKAITVLLVDDNERYRTAFSQNLMLQGMDVLEAEHADQALEILKEKNPDVVVTDLQMRRPTEGLDLIRDARAVRPCLPVIMISAVGTFDEGAQASQLGASHVLSKARIEDEIDILYNSIENSYERYRVARQALDRINKIRSENGNGPREEELQWLRQLLDNPEMETYVKSEAYDLIQNLSGGSTGEGQEAGAENLVAEMLQENMEKVTEKLREQIPEYDKLEDDTREALRTAEYLYQFGEEIGSNLDLSRTICFSYCFSVENQGKAVMKKRISKFVSEPANIALIGDMQEKKSDQVSIFLQQLLLQIMRDHQMDITIDNVRQTFLRIQTHKSKYRPDGLKALGIMILVFGLEYSFQSMQKKVVVENPLGMKGLEREEIIHFAQQLINLQHFRNPYVHPEIDGQKNISAIRETTIECLNLMMRLI